MVLIAPRTEAVGNDAPIQSRQIMREMLDFVARHEKGVRSRSFTDHLWQEAAFPAHDLCAQLTTLDHYGLSGVGWALVDGLLAFAVRSKPATPAGVRSVAH
jgi:hypothetical protein